MVRITGASADFQGLHQQIAPDRNGSKQPHTVLFIPDTYKDKPIKAEYHVTSLVIWICKALSANESYKAKNDGYKPALCHPAI